MSGNKYFLGLVFCIVIMNCNAKIDKTKNESQEYYDFEGIELNKNSVSFYFHYNEYVYFIEFHGKDNITSVNISENNEKSEGIPGLLLDFENYEDKYIINELKKSKIFNQNKIENEMNYMNVTYYAYSDDINVSDKLSSDEHDDVTFLIVPNKVNEPKKYFVTIIPTDELKNYLINTLLQIYYLPLYKVQDGDTLSSICLKLFDDMNYERIVKVNQGMKLPNQYMMVHIVF